MLLISLINSTLALSGGAVVAYSNETDTVNYWKPQVIVGTATKDGYCYFGNDQYAVTSPNFRIQYTGDTLTSITAGFGVYSILSSLTKWTIDLTNITNFSGCFNSFQGSSLDLSNWNLPNASAITYCFVNDTMDYLNLSGWNAPLCKNTSQMFSYSNINYLNLSNTNVLVHYQTFTDLTANTICLSGATIKNCASLFYTANHIKNINLENADTSSVTSWLSFCASSEIESLNLKNVILKGNLREMMYESHSLSDINLDGTNTDEATDFTMMFYGCSSLISLDLSNFNTDNVTAMTNCFYYCSSLASLDISSWNLKNGAYMFNGGCSSLADLKFGYGLKEYINVSDCPLTHTSALSVLNGLATITTTQTITFKATTYSTLTAAEIKDATDKGWAITSA